MTSFPPEVPAPRRIPEDKKATEHLSNERTFLAWVRTSIAVVSLGFVVAKFGLWLERMSAVMPGGPASPARPQASGWSLPIGAGMMATGALLAVLAGWHHQRTSRDIENGCVTPAWTLVWFVSGLVTLLAVVMIAYLLLSAGQK